MTDSSPHTQSDMSRSCRRRNGEIIRIDARTEKTGFLDISAETRDRIYKLAIFDHDRGAVFLPRAVPRKVTESEDVDLPGEVRIYPEESQADTGTEKLWAWSAEGLLSAEDATAGNWVDGRAAAAAPMIDNSSDADVSSPEDELAECQDGEYNEDADAYSIQQQANSNEELFATVDVTVDSSERDSSQSSGSSRTAPYDSDDLSELDDDEFRTLKEEVAVQGINEPPQACVSGDCQNRKCEHCAGSGLGPDQDASRWEDEEDFGYDDDVIEDEEHLDFMEEAGVLYHPREPGILVACKQIRDECLSIYYRENSFSWRFLSYDYPGSYERFDKWLAQTAGGLVESVRHISCEGYHHHEGVEFQVDIDLDKEQYFELRVASDRSEERAERIQDSLEKDMLHMLWKMSGHGRKGMVLTAERLRVLGEAFVNAMHSETRTAATSHTWRRA